MQNLAADKIIKLAQIIPDGDVAELYEDSRRRFDGTNGDAGDGEAAPDTEALPCFSVGTENDFARRSYEWHREIGDALTSPVLAGRSATGIKLTATNKMFCAGNTCSITQKSNTRRVSILLQWRYSCFCHTEGPQCQTAYAVTYLCKCKSSPYFSNI